ncbi:hypothetical protein KCP75_14005 [Salmonella enterica subsp. enterica]|nr:hypothetical protein KCP75_14005 [Salmonella enterica subsp. enterica]
MSQWPGRCRRRRPVVLPVLAGVSLSLIRFAESGRAFAAITRNCVERNREASVCGQSCLRNLSGLNGFTCKMC